VVWDTAARAPVEVQIARMRVRFPYVPGLLSFREVPVLEKVLAQVGSAFQGVMCDGQGIAHPRRFGLASHLGVLLDLPAVGCAKSRLCGSFDMPGPRRGDWSPLLARGDGGAADPVADSERGATGTGSLAERIGTVLRTRDRVNPVFVSPGHRADHASSIAWVLACGGGYRLPEPTRLADRFVAEFKRTGRKPALIAGRVPADPGAR
jgi:deoxyribonuclease V